MTDLAKFLSLGVITLALVSCSTEETPTETSDTEAASASAAASNANEQLAAKPAREPAPLTEAFINQKVVAARGVVKTFAGSLKHELKTAMKAGGAVNALSVCNIKSPEITREVSASQNMKIRRVSLKNRNTGNEPIGWTKKVLEQFETDKQSGTDVSKMEHHELVQIDGEHVFRYMKAIPTGDVCLSCHGSNLKPEVSSKLQELYPGDKATGFNKGDIRGSFVVTEKFKL